MAANALALLSPTDVTEAVDLVKAKGMVGQDTTFRRMAVDESDLSQRRIEVWLYHRDTRKIDELVVSLSTGEVVSSTTVEGMRPQIGFGEIPLGHAAHQGRPPGQGGGGQAGHR